MLISLVALIPSLAFALGGDTEVQFSGKGGLMLSGTLTRPANSFSGARPAVLLLPGSGPTDRDGNSRLGITTDLHKMIAQALAAAGIASLRFDKRAIMRYKDAWPKTVPEMADYFDWPMFVADATAAYRFLKTQPGIAPDRVAIAGHSEGGLIALQIGYDLHGTPEEPAALCLLSTAGRPMGEVIHDQLADVLPKQVDAASAKAWLAYSDAACANLAAGKPIPADTPRALMSLFNPVTVKIMAAYCRIDPAAYARDYTKNVLILNGADDTQVNPKIDAPRLLKALQNRSKGQVEMDIIPQASHNYKSTARGNRDAFDGPADPVMLADLTKFLRANLGP
jgi:uncharacterized protein